MVFCNNDKVALLSLIDEVTILILIDGFLQLTNAEKQELYNIVTILILIDGFLQ